MADKKLTDLPQNTTPDPNAEVYAVESGTAYRVPVQNIQATFAAATTGQAGLMSAADKIKLDGLSLSPIEAAETNAAASATAAADAAASESAAATSATNAAASETAAATSETNAAASESAAATSATNAAASEVDAGQHETTAARYATEAEDTTVVDADTGQDTGDYSALHHAAKAAGSASAAATSESNAASSASAASSSASDAATAETDAQDWATAAEDTQVTDADGNSGYSARHHAAKADASASAAATSESNAATSASNAATSETNAANSASNAATSASNADTYETDAQQHRDDAQAARDAAQTARDDAQQAETDAQSARDAAQVAETDAGQHETTAQRWANEVEDTTVVNADTGSDTGKYSALHHAAKAADSASTAQTAETGATNAESQAQTYRDEAYDWAEAPEDQSVSDSAGNSGFSAYHWAQKAEENAGAVTSVNGETGDVDLNASDVSAAPAAHVGSGGTGAHPAATQSTAGFLSSGDKVKLDGVESGATNYTDSDAQTAVGKADVGLGNVLDQAQIGQGKHTIGLPAPAWTARSTNGAESGTNEFATNDVNLTLFDFDAATEEAIQVAIPMPVSSDESAGLTAIVGWTETAGNTGDVVWGLSALALGDNDAIDSAFGTEVTVTDTVTAQGDLMQSAETATITPAGTWAAGDLVVVQLARKAGDGSDTLGGDARMVNVRLFYTVNAPNDE